MKVIFKKLLVLGVALFLSLGAYSQRKGKSSYKTLSFPLSEKHWIPKSDNVQFVDYKSTKAVKSSNDESFEILLKDQEFSIGTIEFDVELKGMGFPGINFHLDEETGNSEVFYLRYFGRLSPLSRTTMQYAVFIDGINLWDLTDEYQAGAALTENEWNHIKLVISENQMKVYVNNMERAALLVPALEGLTKTGKISLNGDVIYANFKMTPNATEDVPHGVGYDYTYNDPNFLRNWEVQEPIAFAMGKDPMKQIEADLGTTIDPAYYDASKSWSPVSAKYRGMVNLTEKFGATEIGTRRLTWLRTTVTSAREQEKMLRMGFSDEVWVFINGEPLHQNKNYYGSPGMKEPRGRATLENTKFEVPLKEGENEILIGLSNYFFGWGLTARWNDTAGLSY